MSLLQTQGYYHDYKNEQTAESCTTTSVFSEQTSSKIGTVVSRHSEGMYKTQYTQWVLERVVRGRVLTFFLTCFLFIS